jgi:hypothetical protein
MQRRTMVGGQGQSTIPALVVLAVKETSGGQDHLHPGTPSYQASAPLLPPGSKAREHPRRPSHGEGGGAPGPAVRPLQHPPGRPPHCRWARLGRAAIPLDLVAPWPPIYPSPFSSSSIPISGPRSSSYGEAPTGGGPWRTLGATIWLVRLGTVLCYGRRRRPDWEDRGWRGTERGEWKKRKRPAQRVGNNPGMSTNRV